MKNLLAVVGVVLLLVCLWLGLLTLREGGMRKLGPDSRVEILAAGEESLPTRGATWRGQAPPLVAALPTSLPSPTPLPLPSVTPAPAVEKAASVVPAAAVVLTVGTPNQEDLPIGGRLAPLWEQLPVDPGLYAAVPGPVSPWEVLGWILVGIVPAGSFTGLGLAVHRHVALTRARAETIHLRADETGLPPEGLAQEVDRPLQSEATVDLETYLSVTAVG